MNENLLKKLMYQYTVSFFVINLAESLTVLIDHIIVSRNLGATAMAAMGLSTPAFAIMSLLCSFATIGMQTLCSNAMNCGDTKKISAVFNTGVMIVGIIAVLSTVVGILGADYVCMLFGANPAEAELFTTLRSYMFGVTIGMSGYMGYILFSPLAALEGNRRIVSVSAIVQNVLNIVGDLLSVRVFNLGIFGIGLSTGISWLVAFAIMIPIFLNKKSVFRFNLMKPDLKSLKEMSVIGSTKVTRYISKILSRLLINRFVLFFGSTIAMSALSVNHSLTGFVLVVGIGVSECINLCTQMAYTERDKDGLASMMHIARKMIVGLFSLTTLLMVFVFLFAKEIAGFFVINQPELLKYTAFSLRCMAIQIPLNAINCVLIAYLQGSKRIVLTNIMSFLHRFVSLALFTLVLGFSFGIYGVFIAVPASEAAVILVYIFIAFRKAPKSSTLVEKFLVLPPDFDKGIKNSISFSVSTVEEVVSVSEKVNNFLVSAGVEDSSIIYKTSLCVEEMASNVVKYGFHLDKKKHNCDIRIILENDNSIVIRIRDDCPFFNVKERYECIDNGDICSNLGIKLLFAIADEVYYINLLGLNTVQIKLTN